MVGKAKWKLLAPSVSAKLVNQEQFHFPRGTVGITATMKDLKSAGIVIPTTSSFNLPVCPVQKIGGSWRVTVDYHKLIQMLTPLPLLFQIWSHCLRPPLCLSPVRLL